MEFVLEQNFTFEAPVAVRAPDGKESEFTGIFRVIPVTTATEGTDIINALESWRGVKQPDGDALEVTPGNRTALLSWPFVRAAVVNAYLREVNRVPEKNSKTPAAPGPAPAGASRNGAATS